MRRIVLVALLLFTVAWGWNAMDRSIVPVSVAEPRTETSEARQYVDQTISVLLEANRFADVSSGTSHVLPTNAARRFRPGGFSFDYLFVCLITGQNRIIDYSYKSFLLLSQSYAAHLKAMGYYIFTLRKIII